MLNNTDPGMLSVDKLNQAAPTLIKTPVSGKSSFDLSVSCGSAEHYSGTVQKYNLLTFYKMSHADSLCLFTLSATYKSLQIRTSTQRFN